MHIANAATTANTRICFDRLITSNENKMSDGWRESAWLRVEGGISS
jgi:hypothetical protein